MVFDSGGYSASNMRRYNEAKIRWISRVPETSKEAQQVLQEESADWQAFSDGSGQYRTCLMELPQGKERPRDGPDQGRRAGGSCADGEKGPANARTVEQKAVASLHQGFACEQDAEAAWNQAIKGKPSFAGGDLRPSKKKAIISSKAVPPKTPHRIF